MMFKRLLIFLLLSALLKVNLQGQNINVELSKLFFNKDVSNLNNGLLDKFAVDTVLHEFPLHKDTIFHPNHNDAKYIVLRTFSFQSNKYLKFKFVEGTLGVILGQTSDNKDFTVLYFALEFKTQSDLDTGYFEIFKRFKDLGQLEIESFPDKSAVITNIEYEKRFEIIESPLPPNQFGLYLYLKKLKK